MLNKKHHFVVLYHSDKAKFITEKTFSTKLQAAKFADKIRKKKGYSAKVFKY